jgi:hypothetical protein
MASSTPTASSRNLRRSEEGQEPRCHAVARDGNATGAGAGEETVREQAVPWVRERRRSTAFGEALVQSAKAIARPPTDRPAQTVSTNRCVRTRCRNTTSPVRKSPGTKPALDREPWVMARRLHGTAHLAEPVSLTGSAVPLTPRRPPPSPRAAEASDFAEHDDRTREQMEAAFGGLLR